MTTKINDRIGHFNYQGESGRLKPRSAYINLFSILSSSSDLMRTLHHFMNTSPQSQFNATCMLTVMILSNPGPSPIGRRRETPVRGAGYEPSLARGSKRRAKISQTSWGNQRRKPQQRRYDRAPAPREELRQ
nr:hypothetical protein CFP56_56586 [Quercus suber]